MSVQEIIGGYDALARFELAKGIGALPEYEQPRRAAL